MSGRSTQSLGYSKLKPYSALVYVAASNDRVAGGVSCFPPVVGGVVGGGVVGGGVVGGGVVVGVVVGGGVVGGVVGAAQADTTRPSTSMTAKNTVTILNDFFIVPPLIFYYYGTLPSRLLPSFLGWRLRAVAGPEFFL